MASRNNQRGQRGPLCVDYQWGHLERIHDHGRATRRDSSVVTSQVVGGGVWGYSNALVAGCLIVSNAASIGGGGASGVTLSNCSIMGNCVVDNMTSSDSGGGARICRVLNSVVKGNRARLVAGLAGCQAESSLIQGNVGYQWVGVFGGTLINLQVSRNSVTPDNGVGNACAGVLSASATNCIIYDNYVPYGALQPSSNCLNTTLQYSCTVPAVAGQGNITLNPQLLADGWHLRSTSPCLGAGTNRGVRFDLEGQIFTTPPPMGCDQWVAQPTIALDPVVTASGTSWPDPLSEQ